MLPYLFIEDFCEQNTKVGKSTCRKCWHQDIDTHRPMSRRLSMVLA
jgi:hypothetical protein